MYAVQFDGPATDAGATRVVRVNRPTPGPGQLSIDVAFAGINFLDVMTRRGDPGYASGGWPLTPGLEVAGTVRELGPGTTGFRVGDPVAAMVVAGGLAQTAVADAGLVAPVPDGLDLATAAAAPLTLSTVLLLLRDAARLRAGDRLLMFGAGGGLGSVLPAVARTMGAVTLVGTASTPAKAGIAGAAGWDRVLPVVDDVAAAVRTGTDPGFDVILEPTGSHSLVRDLELAAPGARIVLFGNAGGAPPAPLPPVGKLLAGNLGLIGFSITALRRTRPERVAQALARGLTLLAEGRVRLSVTVVDSLADVAAVHDRLAGRTAAGKYVVAVGR